mgnify:CR=1 FL=1
MGLVKDLMTAASVAAGNVASRERDRPPDPTYDDGRPRPISERAKGRVADIVADPDLRDRLLALTGLPMPAMQIARSLSEDVDMALVILIRRKLAERFAACRSAEEASDFWRRHIAGGRAFRAISEKLYAVGIDHSANTDYAKWRKSVLTTLGAAVHSNALKTEAPRRQQGAVLVNGDSLHFATFRIHELCAFAQLLEPGLTGALATAAKSTPSASPLAALAAPMSGIIVNQIQSLSTPPANTPKAAKHH